MLKVLEYKETNYEIIWGYVSVVILVLFSSFSNALFIDNLTNDYAALAFVMLLYLVRYKSIPHIYFKIMLVFAAYNVIHYLIYHDFHPSFFARYTFYISLAFFTIRLNFENFFERLEKVIYYGALISLPLFVLQTLFFGQFYPAMAALEHIMRIIPRAQHDGLYYVNTLFYTINTSGAARNCGFMFEPGAFGSILAITIGLNLVQNKFDLKNKRLIVLLLALITTFSTAAFLSLICLILFYVINKELKKGLILAPAGIVLILVLLQLPFMSNKIDRVSSKPDKQLINAVQMANDTGHLQSLGRFAGLLMNLKDFEKAPVFGLGGHDMLRESEIHKWLVSSVNGLGDYLTTFGAVGILLLLFNLSKTFASLTAEYKVKGFYFLVMVVLIVTFSFVLLPTPLFFSFQIFYISRAKIVTESELEAIANKLSYSSY